MFIVFSIFFFRSLQHAGEAGQREVEVARAVRALDGLGIGACLADDMGLGKTVQLLALLLHRRSGPALLICPLSVIGNWQREAERFAPGLRVTVLHGADRPSPSTLADADVVPLHYGPYATAVVSYLKDLSAQQDRVLGRQVVELRRDTVQARRWARAARQFDRRTAATLAGSKINAPSKPKL